MWGHNLQIKKLGAHISTQVQVGMGHTAPPISCKYQNIYDKVLKPLLLIFY